MIYNPLLATNAIAASAATLYRKNTVDNSGVYLINAPQTAIVESKNTLFDIITAECPSLADPNKAHFVPAPLLPTADFQTCYNAIRERFGKLKIVKYERELITTEDGGTIGLDWSPPFTQMPEDDRPIVVLSHGLSGGSQETYIQTAIKTLTSAPYNFRTVVVNFRGCAGVKLTTHVLYNAGTTSDYDIAVKYIKGRFPQSKLVAIGYSLGANLITKYVGEQGKACPLKAAISVGNPYDLAASSNAIEQPTLRSKYVYSPAILEGLMQLYQRHSKMVATGPVKLDAEAIAKIKTISEYNELITSRIFGYKNSTDYFQQNSCAQFMPNISIPFLAITALDDPLCPESYIPRKIFRSNPHLVLALTMYGGHLGYHESLSQSWLPRPIAEFCSAIFNHTTA